MPTPPTVIDFEPFQLDRRAALLRRSGAPVNLRPKTFDVLLCLVECPGELVTKRALLDTVWPGVAVTEDVVRVSVAELRAALGDDRTAPRFIETVPRRGYRFIAPLGAAPASREAAPALAVDASRQDGTVVGRGRERRRIAEWLHAARSGERRMAFISGEAGIGKTTLVDTAIDELRRRSGDDLRVARGECIEHFGGGEPYLPVLDALAGLCRGDDAETVRASLAEHAPDWFLRALGAPSSEAAGHAAAAATHEHTLHKLAASLDALAAESLLVLVLEDVHWSDYATLDLLSVLAQRRGPARLLVLCTLRPVDAIVRGHPVATVKRELVRKGICDEILLDGLSPADVEAYLAARLDGADLPADLLRLFVDRTEGNPFFLVSLVDHLLDRGLLVRRDAGWDVRGSVEALRTAIPDGLRAVIEPRLERLTLDELRVLETASVVGAEVAAHAIARMAPPDGDLADIEYVEQLCDGLVRRQEILRTSGESTWPDGTTSARYAFRHALYQQVAYQRIPSSTARRLHQAIGEALESAFAGRTMDVASELAAHFARSRDVARAMRYHGEAAAHAGSRLAYQETRLHLQAVLDLLRSQPESRESLKREMSLQSGLGWTLVAISGWGDLETSRAFTRVRELAERLESPKMLLGAMGALRSLHTMRAEYAAARVLCEETIALTEQLGDTMAAGAARNDLGSTLMHLGELEDAHALAERGHALFDEATFSAVANRLLLTATCAHLGRVAESRAMGHEALACAGKLDNPYFRAFASTFVAAGLHDLREVESVRTHAQEAIAIASEYGFSAVRSVASMFLGWCDVTEGRAEEGRSAVQVAFSEYAVSGQRITTTTFSTLLAGAQLACGDAAAANETLDAAFAFAAETGERLSEHELHRLRGECLLVGAPTREQKARAAECFERALEIAAARNALLFELRAATSLFQLRGKPARERVVRLVARFDAANDCADARLARGLLAG